jgi:AraC-like DNA-binding protein
MTAHIEIVPAVVDRIKQTMVGLKCSAPPHFTRFFRDHAGVKPSEFRRVARLGSDAPAPGA